MISTIPVQILPRMEQNGHWGLWDGQDPRRDSCHGTGQHVPSRKQCWRVCTVPRRWRGGERGVVKTGWVWQRAWSVAWPRRVSTPLQLRI